MTLKTAGRIVYTSTADKQPHGDMVRYRMHGLLHRQITLGGKYRTQIKLGTEWVMVLNHELPESGQGPGQYIAHPQDGVCCECGHIYSHLMTSAGQPCDECKLERMAELATKLQRDTGTDLGWHTIDHEGDRERWGYKDQVPRGGTIQTAHLRH